jgi:hypothetical protein
MPAFAGIMRAGAHEGVTEMLARLSHRGQGGQTVVATDQATIGAVWAPGEPSPAQQLEQARTVRDEGADGRLAEVRVAGGLAYLQRDVVDIAPLYYGFTPLRLVWPVFPISSTPVRWRNSSVQATMR